MSLQSSSLFPIFYYNSLLASSKMTEVMKFGSFVFLDLESTGIPFREPDGKRTRITEVSMVSVSRSHLLKCDNFMPRILHKITIPVNPRKLISDEASRMTGLDNFLLENELPFNEKKVMALKSFLDQCQPPLCFIAHNGYRFDFPLLKEELKRFDSIIPDGTCCSDSLPAFRELSQQDFCERSITLNPDVTDVDLIFSKMADDIEKKYKSAGEEAFKKSMEFMRQLNETTPESKAVSSHIDRTAFKGRKLFCDEKKGTKTKKSFRLVDIYERLFGEPLRNSHCAEDDVIALVKCCAKYGESIIDWFENNNKNFADIQPLYS